MTFNHFVKRYSRGVMIFIVLMIAIPMMIAGNIGGPASDPELEEDAGIIDGAVHVSKYEYNHQLLRATASFIWNVIQDDPTLNDRRFRAYRSQFLTGVLQRVRPTPKDLHDTAWDNVILLRDAVAKGITGDEKDFQDQLQKIIDATGLQSEVRKGFIDQVLAQRIFRTAPSVFRAWVADQVLIDKLLDLMSDGAFARYQSIYEQIDRENRRARAWIAEIDPAEYTSLRRSITAEEVADNYERNKVRYKVGNKIQLSYLMAELETMEKAVPEPSDEEIKKLYEEMKDPEFRIFDAPQREGAAPEKKFKPLAEVRDKVVERFKSDASLKSARGVMGRVNTALGEIPSKDGVYPAEAFADLKEKFKKEGVQLVHDMTTLFSPAQIDAIEDVVGTGSGIREWGFVPGLSVGTVTEGLRTTSIGVALFRLDRKADEYDPGVTASIRARIEAEMLKDQDRDRAREAADALVKTINVHGLEAARRGDHRAWAMTPYFDVAGVAIRGVDDRSVARQLLNDVGGEILKRGTAKILSGGGDKEDWAYVAYLEDLVHVEPRNLESDFRNMRAALDEEEQRVFRRRYVSTLRESVALEDFMKEDSETGSSSAP